MGLPVVTNRVPDLDNFFVEGLDYIGFSNLREGIAKTRWDVDILPVVDGQRRFVGTVSRPALTASLILSITEQLEAR